MHKERSRFTFCAHDLASNSSYHELVESWGVVTAAAAPPHRRLRRIRGEFVELKNFFLYWKKICKSTFRWFNSSALLLLDQFARVLNCAEWDEEAPFRNNLNSAKVCSVVEHFVNRALDLVERGWLNLFLSRRETHFRFPIAKGDSSRKLRAGFYV